MKPDWSTADGSIALYCADCLDILPELEAGSVDALVTDPPYGIGLRNGDVDGHRSDRWDSIAGDDSQEVGLEVLEWARQPCVTVIVFASPEKPWPGKWRNRIVWNKGGAVGGGGDIATCLKRTWELIQVWNPRPHYGPRLESVWHFAITPQDTRDHIAAKPEPLMVKLLQVYTIKGDMVCDPFMGSGTTGVACVRTGRRFVGIEKEPKYFKIACDRIQKELERAPLFEPAPTIQRTLIE